MASVSDIINQWGSDLTDTSNLGKYLGLTAQQAVQQTTGSNSIDISAGGTSFGSLTFGGNNTTLLLVVAVIVLVWSQ